MSRSLKYEIPGEDPRVAASEIAEKGWTALFGRPEPAPARVLEIGFGRGEFLLAMAAERPELDFIGLEISFKRTLKMARKVARARLTNVRLLDARAEHAIEACFAPESLAEIWINFSDPWPKRRHAHRRLLQSPFVRNAARALLPGATLYVATDDVPYAHQIDCVLAREPRLVNDYAPFAFLAEVRGRRMTGYEAQWRAAGRPLHFFAYRRAESDPSVRDEVAR